VSAVGGTGAGGAKAGRHGHVGTEPDIPGFDPLKVGVYDTAATSAAALLFDTLTELDEAGAVNPKLADTWSHSPDFKVWSFNLHRGVEFSDGTPFDAAAVKFNYDRLLDPKNHCHCAFYISNIKGVEAPDPSTVVFRLRDTAVDLSARLHAAVVVNVFHSPTAIGKLGDDHNRNPVGTGPFAPASPAMAPMIAHLALTARSASSSCSSRQADGNGDPHWAQKR
jgi:4-phytase/acid phosphatase/peptide/nickel transport system substrate-binding protein